MNQSQKSDIQYNMASDWISKLNFETPLNVIILNVFKPKVSS